MISVPLTIASGTVASNLTNFPVMVRLSHLPGEFWDAVRADGRDIQLFEAGSPSTRLPVDLVRFDYDAQDGVLFFRAPSLLAASDNVFNVVCGVAAFPFVPTVTSLAVTNTGADTDVAGWTASTGSLARRTASPSPAVGAGYFSCGSNAETRAYQDVAIPSGENSGIDAGLRVARLRWQQAGFATSDHDRGEMEMEFFDGSSVSLGTRVGRGAIQNGNFANLADQSWRGRELRLLIPANARTIRISMHGIRSSGTNLDAYFDDIALAILDMDAYGREQCWSGYASVHLFGEDPRDRTGRSFAVTNFDPNHFVVVATSPTLTGGIGVCSDATYYYVTSGTTIYKYDAAWSLVASNGAILSDSAVSGASAIGDLDVYNGVLYVGLSANSGANRYLMTVDASTLAFIAAVEVTAHVGAVTTVCVRPTTETVFIASVSDRTALYEFDLDGAFVGALTLLNASALDSIQGLTYWRGAFWASCKSTLLETYKIDDDGWVLNSGLYGDSTVTDWYGIGHTDGALLQMQRSAAGGGTNNVKTWSPNDHALSAGGGCTFIADANLFGGGVRSVTTFTLGCSAAISSKSTARSAVNYCAAKTPTTARVALMYRSSTSKLTLWDSTANGFLDGTTNPTLNVGYRLHAVYNGTASRKLYVNGTQEATASSITAAPSAIDTILVGAEDEAPSQAWRGDLGFVYLFPGVLSADFLAAEYANLNNPAAFYGLDAAEAGTPGATSHGFRNDASPSAPLVINHTSDGTPLYVLLTWFVGVGGIDNSNAVSSVTFDGVALARGGHSAQPGNTMEWYKLQGPSVGNANVVVHMAATRRVSAAAVHLVGWPEAIADHTFAANGNVASTEQPNVEVASVIGAAAIDWLGFNNRDQDVTAGVGQTEEWNEEGLGTLPDAAGEQLSAGSRKTSAGSTVSTSWNLAVTTDYWGLAILSAQIVSQDTRCTSFFRELWIDEDAEDIATPEACSGGGTVASGGAPDEGTSLATATTPLVWMELTLAASPATVYRWAGLHIPHGEPKEKRVVRWGEIDRSLCDPDGGPQSAHAEILLSDTDGLLRGLHSADALRNAPVDIFIADEATARADGTPFRVFRGFVAECTPNADLTFTLALEDALTAQLTDIDGEDLQTPTVLIDETIANLAATEQAFDTPLCDLYGDLSGIGGAWQLQFVGVATFAGREDLGPLAWFSVSDGVVRIRTVWLASLAAGANPNQRVQVPESAFGQSIFRPEDLTGNSWFEFNGRRMTLVAALSNSPAVKLAKSGTVPMVVEACGHETVGDGTGATINSIPRAHVHYLNNRVLQDATANWLPIVAVDGVALIDTASFERAHAILQTLLYDVSPSIATGIGFDGQKNYRDVEADFCRNGGYDVGINRHGQRMAAILDTTDDAADAPQFDETKLLEGSVQPGERLPVENLIRHVNTENYVETLPSLTPQTDARLPNDPFSGAWKSGMQKVQNDDSIADLGGGQRGIRRSEVQEHNMLRSADASAMMATARRDLLSVTNGRKEPTVGLWLRHGYVLELGDIATFKHWDLPWTGYRRCQIRRSKLNLDELFYSFGIRDVDELLP